MHSFTYAGNPIACAGASAVLKYIVDKDLISRSEKTGKIFLEKLKDGLGDLEIVSDIRGIGLLIGIEFSKDKERGEPFESDFNVCGKVTKYCFEHNLIVASGISGTVDGIKGDALQLSPPFVIEEEEDMDFAVATLRDAILDVINSIK
jgi:adenosylmethionine-8-amino-7-oxononanoate aminotransferase